MSRGIVFDLDDTLYPERRFALSGFIAVAREAERLYGAPSGAGFAILRRALARGHRHTALQDLVSRFGLPGDAIELLRSVFRLHEPRLRLPRESAVVLRELKRDWKLGILTNGRPDVQARKIAALGLSDVVDVIVFGLDTGAGKPELAAFSTVLDRLRVRPRESVFVGDDPQCDIMGARRAGMKTVRIRRGVHGLALVTPDDEADAAIDSLKEVPTIAAGLVAAAVHDDRSDVLSAPSHTPFFASGDPASAKVELAR